MMSTHPTFNCQSGRKIGYRHVNSTGPFVVLLHGWMMRGPVFDPLLSNLDLAGRQWLIPDQIPLEGPDYEVGQSGYVADVISLLDLHGIERTTIIGHSMGGQTAQALAARHPDRVAALALLCAVPASGMKLPEEFLRTMRESGGDRNVLRGLLESVCLRLQNDERERLLNLALSVPASQIVNGLETWTGADFVNELYAIQSPTLVVATDDPVITRQIQQSEIADRIPGARLHHLSRLGHYPANEDPAGTARVLTSFLNQHGSV